MSVNKSGRVPAGGVSPAATAQEAAAACEAVAEEIRQLSYFGVAEIPILAGIGPLA